VRLLNGAFVPCHFYVSPYNDYPGTSYWVSGNASFLVAEPWTTTIVARNVFLRGMTVTVDYKRVYGLPLLAVIKNQVVLDAT
jgi:hypothetical protein